MIGAWYIYIEWLKVRILLNSILYNLTGFIVAETSAFDRGKSNKVFEYHNIGVQFYICIYGYIEAWPKKENTRLLNIYILSQIIITAVNVVNVINIVNVDN